jgi:hypothetical protein
MACAKARYGFANRRVAAEISGKSGATSTALARVVLAAAA